MVLSVIVLLAAAAVGFGLGRVKNSAKLAAVKSEVEKAESSVVAEVKALVAAIKAKL